MFKHKPIWNWLNINWFETGLNVNRFETILSASVNGAIIVFYRKQFPMRIRGIYSPKPIWNHFETDLNC